MHDNQKNLRDLRVLCGSVNPVERGNYSALKKFFARPNCGIIPAVSPHSGRISRVGWVKSAQTHQTRVARPPVREGRSSRRHSTATATMVEYVETIPVTTIHRRYRHTSNENPSSHPSRCVRRRHGDIFTPHGCPRRDLPKSGVKNRRHRRVLGRTRLASQRERLFFGRRE